MRQGWSSHPRSGRFGGDPARAFAGGGLFASSDALLHAPTLCCTTLPMSGCGQRLVHTHEGAAPDVHDQVDAIFDWPVWDGDPQRKKKDVYFA